MIAKTAYLISSPFDIGYENVPDLQDNTINNAKNVFIAKLEQYFSSINPLRYAINEFYPDGLSIPYNLEQEVTIKFNNIDDRDILNKNYIIFTDAFIEPIDVNPNFVQLTDKNCCFYFIREVKINNNATGKSATFYLVKDLWTEYYETFIETRQQQIIRRHEVLSEGLYSLDIPPTQFIQRSLSGLSDDKIVLFLKVLLDTNVDLKLNSLSELDSGLKSMDVVINRGSFRELLIPIQPYRKNGYIDHESLNLGYGIRFFQELTGTYTIENRQYYSGQINLKSQYIVGAYLTFQPEIYYTDGDGMVIFGDDYVYGSVVLNNSEPIGLAGIIKLRGSVSSLEDDIDISGYNNNNYYNLFKYYENTVHYEENAKISSSDLSKITVENFLSCCSYPCMRVGGVDTKIITKGKAIINHNYAGTQSGIVNRFAIYENGKLINSNFISNMLSSSNAQIPVSVSQYDLYFQNNSNAHNLKLINANSEKWSSTASLITSGLDLSGSIVTAVGSKGTTELAKDVAGAKTALGETSDVISNALRVRNAVEKEKYLSKGLTEDLLKQTSSIKGSGTYNGNFENDRVLFYYEQINDELVESRQYFYRCHIYGTLIPRVGYVRTNYRNRFDYVQTDDYTSFIPNVIERIKYNSIFNNGVRKIHLEHMMGNEKIEYMYPNKPREGTTINE